MGKGKVIINLEIYKTMIASTVRYANARIPEDQWAEVYGLLYGYNKDDNVHITEAIPFTHTKKKGHILKVEFDEEDYALAADIETNFMVKDPPQFIVGWFHSHPGIRVMLSQDDVKTQLAWQSNNPLACAIVFNHVRLAKQYEVPSKKGDPIQPLQNDTGFMCFRLDDVNRGIEANYHTIPFELADAKTDVSLIKNAQEFMGWVTKAFPRDEGVVTEYKRFVDNSVSKLDELYNGTQSYLKTLIRKDESSRVTSVLEMQSQEAQKILDQGNTMVSVYRMVVPYLEYKEREKLVPQIEEVLKLWDEKSKNFMATLKDLPQTISKS